MLIHRVRDQDADEVMPARRLELIPTDIRLARPAAPIANSRQDFPQAGWTRIGSAGPGRNGSGLSPKCQAFRDSRCGRPARIISLNSHASSDSSQFEANVYAYAVTACP
jgi:hypothetical protein